jgi:hypothetical protein
MAGSIFISYRRDDAAAEARAIYLALEQAFGRARIFMDIDGIEPGEDFGTKLGDTLRKCKAVVVVIGPRWLELFKAKANSHLQNQVFDYARMEIADALDQGKVILPVLVGGARMPDEMEIYGEIMGLSRCQAIDIRHVHFSNDAEQLIKALIRVAGRPGRTAALPWAIAGGAGLAALAGVWMLGGWPGLSGMLATMPAAGVAVDVPPARVAAKEAKAVCTYEPFAGGVLPGGAATVISLISSASTPCRLANFNGQGQPPANLALLRRPRSGEATILPPGVVSYTPSKDFVGQDHFVVHSTTEPYQLAVVVVVKAEGQAEARTDPEAFGVACDVAAFGGAALPGGSGTVMKLRNTGTACRIRNRPRPGQPDLDLVIVRAPRNGEAKILPGGIVDYTPGAGFAGRDNFAYRSPSQPFAVSVNVVVTK